MTKSLLYYFLTTVSCVSLFIVPAADTTAQSIDQIQTVSGARLEGKVVSATPLQVTIEVRGSQQPVTVNEIKYVMFAEDPPEMRAGRARILAGKYAAGLADLKRIIPAELKREFVQRDLQFYLAYASGRTTLSSGGDKKAAVDAMLAFVRAAPTSHHFFQAAQLLGDLSVAQGDFAGAVKYYGAIASKAPWPEYKMDAQMAQARALIAQGDFVEAQERYESVLAAESGTKEAKRQKLFAEVGMARCLTETGSADEGIGMIEEMIAKNDAADTELFGRFYNALGDCFMKVGKKKDALMAYLHVDVLFYANPETHAESLYHLSQLWSDLKNPDRSVAARKLLHERYGGSIWASKEQRPGK